jgi:hypothetical protein
MTTRERRPEPGIPEQPHAREAELARVATLARSLAALANDYAIDAPPLAPLEQIDFVEAAGRLERIAEELNKNIDQNTSYARIPPPSITGQNDEGNLIDEFRQNADILSALERCGVSATVIGLVAAELSERAKSRPPHEEIKPPLPVLTAKQLRDIKEHAKKRPWSKRREFGYAWRTNVFEFVAAEYIRWIPGLTQAHLMVDVELHRFLLTQVCLQGLPKWLDVPAEREARIRNITDPVERAQRMGWREIERHRSRKRRGPLITT